jgi:hypothetical protein
MSMYWKAMLDGYSSPQPTDRPIGTVPSLRCVQAEVVKGR